MIIDALKFCGLLYRASKLVIGDTAKEKLKKGKTKLLILANDISQNSLEEINSLNHHNVKTISFANKIELGNAVGKSNVVVMAILDIKANEALLNKINNK